MGAIAQALLQRTVMATHRTALARVPRWLPPKTGRYGAGNINYGVQPQTEPHLDSPLPLVATYSDVLAWLLLSGESPCYLEIGVSVGKNLHQLLASAARYTSGSTLVGLDLEPFNPQLLSTFPAHRRIAEWESPTRVDEGDQPSYKLDPLSTLEEHAADGVRFFYCSADLKARRTWDQLEAQLPAELAQLQPEAAAAGAAAPRPLTESLPAELMDLAMRPPAGREEGVFDLVFSDAWHSPSAVWWELRQLLERKLLSPQAVVVWDDLNSRGMQAAFGTMCATLKAHHPAVRDGRAPIECLFSAIAPGWVVSNSSDLIGIVGPADVLQRAQLDLILPSKLTLADFGYSVDPPSRT